MSRVFHNLCGLFGSATLYPFEFLQYPTNIPSFDLESNLVRLCLGIWVNILHPNTLKCDKFILLFVQTSNDIFPLTALEGDRFFNYSCFDGIFLKSLVQFCIFQHASCFFNQRLFFQLLRFARDSMKSLFDDEFLRS